MRTIVWILGTLVLCFFVASVIHNTEWSKERNKRIWGWFCESTGGHNFWIDGWVVHCEYTVNKRGELVRP